MGKEDRQFSYSEEQGNTLITYSAGVSAEGTPQESMINVGVIKGGVVFSAVEAIYSSDGKIDAYLVHNTDQLEWRKPRENALREIDNTFVVRNIMPFESITLPVHVDGLSALLDEGNVTSGKMEKYAVSLTPKTDREQSNITTFEPRTRKPLEHLSATGDE